MNEQAKAWIDYRVDDLRSQVGQLDATGCVINPTVDQAMNVAAINNLTNLRELMDGPAPVGYPPATHVYLHDADLQLLRHKCSQP
jgi:hypothetical protein